MLIRKNQGCESGASQPHLHNQVIGSDIPFAAVTRECEITAREPHIGEELVTFSRAHGFLLEERDGCWAYFCPFGVFPRGYELVCSIFHPAWPPTPSGRASDRAGQGVIVRKANKVALTD